ncbi:MAG TPA: cation:proton antiporter, partial [Myxococcota bacterium]|nr:cation:proton antiporter [Myxococcota bacterium]
METLLVFAVVLLFAVLLSGLASRSVLSTSVLFLAAGMATGPAGAGWIRFEPTDPFVERIADLALFSVLFTDGMRVGVRELARAWRLPGRALLFGLPLTLLGVAALARALIGFDWADALLVGAVLAPTDPVFAAAIVGREEVPARLRRLLNVESGLNDGLALPVVLALLTHAGVGHASLGALLAEVALGIALGVAIPWAVLRLEASRAFQA